MTQEVRTWDSGTEADTLTYSYTNNNQLTGVTHTNNSFTNESFTWDANGNETGTGYTTGTDNEQTASPGYTYTYDNAGEHDLGDSDLNRRRLDVRLRLPPAR